MIDRFHALAIDQSYAISSGVDVVLPQENIFRSFLRYIVSNACGNGTGTLKKKSEGFLQGFVFGEKFFLDHSADHLVNDSSASRVEETDVPNNPVLEIRQTVFCLQLPFL